MLLEFHTFLDLIRDLIRIADLGKILLLQIIRHTCDTLLIVESHPRRIDHLLVNVGRNHLDVCKRQVSGQCHYQRIRLISGRAGSTPDFQILAKLLNQLREHLILQNLPLIRIAVKLRHIDGQEIDKLFKLLFVLLDQRHILIICRNMILRNQRVDSAPHLLFLIRIQINLCKR